MNIKILLFLLANTLFCAITAAQSEKVQQVQPTIMVIPWTAKGEDIRDKIDNNFMYRAILSKIKEAFDYRGFTTYDFITAYNNTQINDVQDWGKLQTLFKDIANNSSCDIYIKADINIYQGGTNGNRVDILLEAVDNYTNQSLANTSLASRPIRTDDYVLLAQQALENNDAFRQNTGVGSSSTKSFLDLLNEKFADMRANGRTIEVRIVVDANSDITLDEEVGSDYELLSELITSWLKKNAFQNYVRSKTNTSSLLHFDAVKIPLRNSNGENYDINDFVNQLRRHVASLGTKTSHGGRLRVTRDIRGNTATITISTN
jgi:hypothetical protein